MRDLNECRAEVFRRSEKRIKARRRRTVRTLAICIPLVLCLASLPLLSGIFPGSTRDPVATVTTLSAPAGVQPESFTCSVAKITVSGPDFSRSITEISDIGPVADKFLAYSTYSAGLGAIVNESAQDDNTAATTNSYIQDISTEHSAAASYTVTLVMHDGTKIVYSLAGSILRDLSAGQEYVLIPQDAENLAKLLGLPQGKDLP